MPTPTPFLIPTARIPLCCPSCGTLATVIFDGRRLSAATPHRLSADTVWLPDPFPLPTAPASPAGYPHKTRHEAMAHFGTCLACRTPLLTLSISIASHATPIIRGHFVHDDAHLGIGASETASRTLAASPALYTVYSPATALQSWSMLREHYSSTQVVVETPAARRLLVVDQHILNPVVISTDDLSTLRGPGGLAIQHESLAFWLPHLATLHAIAPPLPSLAAAAAQSAANSTPSTIAAPLAA